METLKHYTHKTDGRELKIYADETTENPREWDNLGVMICRHSRYNLGDEQDNSFNGSFEEFESYLIKERGAVVILPLTLYDHSGLSISTTSEYPFNCRWDSSRVGYIIATADTIKKEYGVKRISKKLKAKVRDILKGEVETYDQYLRGEVYGFEVLSPKICECCQHSEDEILDSCWGFYGDDFNENGLFENAGIDISEWDEVEQ